MQAVEGYRRRLDELSKDYFRQVRSLESKGVDCLRQERAGQDVATALSERT